MRSPPVCSPTRCCCSRTTKPPARRRRARTRRRAPPRRRRASGWSTRSGACRCRGRRVVVVPRALIRSFGAGGRSSRCADGTGGGLTPGKNSVRIHVAARPAVRSWSRAPGSVHNGGVRRGWPSRGRPNHVGAVTTNKLATPSRELRGRSPRGVSRADDLLLALFDDFGPWPEARFRDQSGCVVIERANEAAVGTVTARSRSTVSVRTTTRRHPSDVLRLVLGLALLTWAAIAAGSADPSRVEVNLFRLVNQLPDAAGAPLLGVMQLGALFAVPVVAAVCVLGRRSRLAKLIVLGGVVAWLVAKGLETLVGQRPPGRAAHRCGPPWCGHARVVVSGDACAVAAAMATVASPYLGRSARRTTWLLVALVAVARVYVGAHFPADVLGGFAVGWVVGSAIHLVFGRTSRVPGPSRARGPAGRRRPRDRRDRAG